MDMVRIRRREQVTRVAERILLASIALLSMGAIAKVLA
jgi:hypothetical protein